MRRVALVTLLILQCYILSAQVGTWRAYMSYYEPQQIVKADNYLFVLASNDLYQYNMNDQSITTYDKINGLSDSYITILPGTNRSSASLPFIRMPTSTSLTSMATSPTYRRSTARR